MSNKSSHVPVTDSICLTKLNYRKCTYLWAIENYSFHDKRKLVLKSLPFSAHDDKFKWRVHLNPVYYTSSYYYVALYLYPSEECSDFTEHSPIMGTLKFAIVDAENKEKHPQTIEFTLTSGTSNTCAGFPQFILTSTLFTAANKLLLEDKLSIFCEISYVKETDIVYISSEPFSNSLEREPACLDDIEMLFMNKEFSDVTLSVKKKSFPAHKSILVARCPVFKAMLSHDMKEKQSDCIELQDINLPVFKEMLRYIYTGTVQNLKCLAPELLAAADKYDIRNLKAICEKELYEKLSQDTAVNTLMLADMYHAKKLKNQALLYIKIHSYTSNILSQEVRKTMVESFPHLLLEIIDTFGKQGPM
ncbi:speckle-type POZ protein-like [Planococcus citri]|uniref:speckle-type POZ protein-like n=1 Tax=Planococcus citri TaxID=170843 RepID=UPI0031F92FA1